MTEESIHKSFIRFSWFVLGMVFLVILAGGVVRMTQSGMGCPDWPKCFGMWIPPTDVNQLPADFEKYLEKQDIDHTFNVYHTWIEYINRLLGALLGLVILIYLIYAFMRFRKRDIIIVLSILFLFVLTGFQGFLGKLVVDANLAVVKVTAHMLIAILIAAVPIFIIARLRTKKIMVPAVLKTLPLIALFLVIVQIILGTQVREQIDEISKALNYDQRNLWIDGLDYVFLIHRSFSWLILLTCGYLWWKSRLFKGLQISSRFIFTLVLISVITGIAMNYFDMPAIAQPIHLLTATLLSVSLFYYRLIVR